MSKLSGIIASVAIAFASTSAMAEEKLDPQNGESHRYSNFITTLKSLCKTHKNILLGDTNHTDPAILKLTADKDVLQAVKDCGATFVLEAGIEENEGYPKPKFEVNPEKISENIAIIQEYLYARGFEEIKQTGIFDEGTNLAFYGFISSLQGKLSWTKDPAGIYSTEFAKILKNNAEEQDLKFLAAAEYLDGAGYLPVRATKHTAYQDAQDGYIEYTGKEYLDAPEFAGDMHYAEIAQLEFDRLYNAAKIDLPLIYPDPRYKPLAQDQELSNNIDSLLFTGEILSKNASIYQDIELSAKANKDYSFRPLMLKTEDFLKQSVSVKTNQAIADNMRLLTTPNLIVALYGFGHISEENDLDEMLGRGGKTVTIVLKTHSEQKFFTHHPDNPDSIIIGNDAPDYVYNIQDNEMTKIEEGTVSEQAYTSMIKYSITIDEYETAVSQLPNDLKPYAFPYTEYDSDLDNNVVPDNWLETDYQYKNPELEQKSDAFPSRRFKIRANPTLDI